MCRRDWRCLFTAVGDYVTLFNMSILPCFSHFVLLWFCDMLSVLLNELLVYHMSAGKCSLCLLCV